jgi:hypothetical protein
VRAQPEVGPARSLAAKELGRNDSQAEDVGCWSQGTSLADLRCEVSGRVPAHPGHEGDATQRRDQVGIRDLEQIRKQEDVLRLEVGMGAEPLDLPKRLRDLGDDGLDLAQ